MSIPPLVCSTPPPLEQVECEDTIVDDFSISYHLSQEEDEFCSYADFGPTPSITEEIHNEEFCNYVDSNASLPKCEDTENCVDFKSKGDKNYEIDNSVVKIKLEEENNVEDLDLKCESLTIKAEVVSKLDENNFKDNNKPGNDGDCITDPAKTDNQNQIDFYSNKLKSIDIPKTNDTDIATVELKSQKENVQTDTSTSLKQIKSTEIYEENLFVGNNIDELSEKENQSRFDNRNNSDEPKITNTSNSPIEEECLSDFNFVETDINLEKEVLTDLGLNNIGIASNVESDQGLINKTEGNFDDFGDFDTFQSTTIKEDRSQVVEDVYSNPWTSEVSADFGDFQATFEEPSSEFQTNFNESPSVFQPYVDEEQKINNKAVSNSVEDEDDFGDFDDFRSSQSVQLASQNNDPDPMNFAITDNENQLYENIEKSIHSIYAENISEEENNPESKLESLLSVTWRHLTETEVRQPYMVQWNNSTSQKALLKALGIDSRNILFGPKWNSNVPKYASNLSTAPLQPVSKPTSSKTLPCTTETNEADKQKGGNAWTDTIASEGQESCHDESPSTKQSVIDTKSIPYQDEMLKPTKIFSSTLPLQPLRQISLPDTHIFTPTDSEEPRSKTIHYTNPSTELPYTKADSQLTNAQSDDFDEFQDFQGCARKLPDPNLIKKETEDSKKKEDKNVLPPFVGNASFQTQTILEPVKLEPTVPVLNWPEPGDVKETFEDFSDFVSSSSWSNFNSASLQSANEQIEVEKSDKTTQSFKLNNESAVEKGKNDDVEEDEFNNFQFVEMLPQSIETKLTEIKKDTIPHMNHSIDIKSTLIPSTKIDFTLNASTEMKSILDPLPKSEIKSQPESQSLQSSQISQEPSQKWDSTLFTTPIPFNDILQPMKPLQMPTTSIPSIAPSSSNQILQPLSLDKLNSSPEKSTSQQILQPLSLESISQINWPNPGMDLQDLSRFNPLNAVHSLHNSPIKSTSKNQLDDDGWGEFVSIKPSKTVPPAPKVQSVTKQPDDDDWSDFVSNVTPKPNGVNTISFNVHTNLSQKQSALKPQEVPCVSMPSLNYVTPKANQKVVKNSQFQNL